MDEYFLSLKKKTIILYVIFSLGIVGVSFHHYFYYQTLSSAGFLVSLLCLIGIIVFSLILPAIIRIIYWQYSRKNGTITKSDFKQMKNLLLYSISLGSVFTLFAYMAFISKGFLIASMLIAIYGIYSIWPSVKMFNSEMRTFRVSNKEK